MLDIRLIREKPDFVRDALKKRNCDVDFTELLGWDADRRAIIGQVEQMKNDRNVTSKNIPLMKKRGEDVSGEVRRMKELGEQIAAADARLAETEKKITDFLLGLPNMPAPDVVAGGKENNQVDHEWGKKPEFSFKIKNHVDLCTSLGLIDYERGVKLAGQGCWLYTGLGAQLEWAILNYFIRTHIKDGYTFILPPHMLGYQCGYVAGQFPKYVAEDYWIDGGPDEKGHFLLPTAETALVNLHRDEIIPEAELPKKYFAYTPCFRREAGSARTEERGMIRGHQFNKVEMVQYAHPDHSEEAFAELVRKAEALVQGLGLHYRLSRLHGQDLRHRGLDPFDGHLQGSQLRLKRLRLPAPPRQHPHEGRRRQDPPRAHPQRLGPRHEPRHPGHRRAVPAGGRLGRRPRGAPRRHGRRRHPPPRLARGSAGVGMQIS